MGRPKYSRFKVNLDNRDKEGTWILDGERMAIAYKWKCPFCFDRDTSPKPYCHNCGAKLNKEITR